MDARTPTMDSGRDRASGRGGWKRTWWSWMAMVTVVAAQGTSSTFTLHPNGVTVLCPNAGFGETGTVNGVVYTKRTKEQITPANAATTCTSGITDMNS
eukprot:scaffold3371_cov802-Pavlova_lutheri.AAC.1